MSTIKQVVISGSIGATSGVVPGWLLPVALLFPCQTLPVSQSVKNTIGFYTMLLAFAGYMPASIGGAIGGVIGGLTTSSKSDCARNGLIGGIALPIVGVVVLIVKEEFYPSTTNANNSLE